MQDLCGGHSARQLPINIDIFAIDCGFDAHFCAARLRTFIDATSGRDVRVLIDDSGSDVLPTSINRFIFRNLGPKHGIGIKPHTNRQNFSIVQYEISS